MKKIKVLHIITRLDPGGSSTNTIETVARLNCQQFDVHLISGPTNDPDGTIEASLNKREISYAFFANLQREINVWKDLKTFYQIFIFLRKNTFDIVHTHTSKAGILGRLAAKCAGVPYIVHTPHGHVFYGYFGKFKTQLFIWIERLTGMITHKIITLTDRGTREHIDFKIAPAHKFITIYSGIDAHPVDHTIDASLEIPVGSFVFGTVARLDPIKGMTYLIDAMSLVVRQYPQSYLLVVGDGCESEKLKEQCRKLGLENKVLFTGFQKTPSYFIKRMDVFILPSLNEGMGRVILEAMVHAKPVIASNVGGIPELIDDGQNGILVPPANAPALAAAMSRLIGQEPLLKKMGILSQAKVSEKFSLERMIKDIESLYVHLIEPKR